MSDKCGIYKITNLSSGKYIIGQSIKIMGRWSQYRCLLRQNKYPNAHLQSAWNKYGEYNFKFEIILECPESDLSKEEIRLIKEHNAVDRNIGYNFRKGGMTTFNPSETRKKLSDAGKGKKLSEEIRGKISKSKKGLTFSEESKLKMSKSHIGIKLSEKHKKNIGIAGKNRVVSDETREKISLANKGHGPTLLEHSKESKIKMSQIKKGSNNPMYKKQHSEEARRKMSEASRAYWLNKNK